MMRRIVAVLICTGIVGYIAYMMWVLYLARLGCLDDDGTWIKSICVR